MTDGRWIIVFGLGGWSRYIAEFGLMSCAILVLALRSRRYELDPFTVVLSMVLAGNMLDLVPNSGVSPVTWLLGGALAGRLELAKARADIVEEAGQASDEAKAPPETRGAFVYSRRGVAPSPAPLPTPSTSRYTRFDRTGGRDS